MIRGVRGATTAEANTREAILAATSELLSLMIEANKIEADDVASAIFTTTIDLNADYPALAARALGWNEVALMCMHEMNVPHGLNMCVRILLHWNTEVSAQDVKHVYIKGAVNLRPDRAGNLGSLKLTSGG
jgi:chorismate mutase